MEGIAYENVIKYVFAFKSNLVFVQYVISFRIELQNRPPVDRLVQNVTITTADTRKYIRYISELYNDGDLVLKMKIHRLGCLGYFERQSLQLRESSFHSHKILEGKGP